MKTKLFYFLMVIIVMGMIIPAFAVSPDKDKGDKVKTDNRALSPLPPSPWDLRIQVIDNDTCGAQNCNLAFFIQTATINCIGAPSVPPWSDIIRYHKGTINYSDRIPDYVSCVIVSIIDLGNPNCGYFFNSNTCCECQADNNVCQLKICP